MTFSHSTAAVPLFVVTRGYPLEIVSTTDAWLKVKDHAGALNWIERKAVSTRRTVVVTAARAEEKAGVGVDSPRDAEGER